MAPITTRMKRRDDLCLRVIFFTQARDRNFFLQGSVKGKVLLLDSLIALEETKTLSHQVQFPLSLVSIKYKHFLLFGLVAPVTNTSIWLAARVSQEKGNTSSTSQVRYCFVWCMINSLVVGVAKLGMPTRQPEIGFGNWLGTAPVANTLTWLASHIFIHALRQSSKWYDEKWDLFNIRYKLHTCIFRIVCLPKKNSLWISG